MINCVSRVPIRPLAVDRCSGVIGLDYKQSTRVRTSPVFSYVHIPRIASHPGDVYRHFVAIVRSGVSQVSMLRVAI